MQQLALTIPFFALIAVGYVCGRTQKITLEGMRWLNFFLIYVALPALFFQLLSKTPIEQLGQWNFIASTTFATACVFVISFTAGWWFSRKSIGEAAIAGVLGAYSNIGYMGPGLTMAAFGAASAVPTALVFCFDNALIFTLTPLLTALASHHAQKGLALTIAKRIILHPFILATLAGVGAAAFHIVLPTPIDKTLELAKNAAAPCALFAMGVTLALTPFKGFSAEVGFHLCVKMILHPILVYSILKTTGNYDPIWIKTAVLMAALPPALNVYILAQNAGFFVGKAASGVLIGTIISLVSVNVVLFLLG